jgi:hypothetical protein
MRGFGGGGARRHSNRTNDLENVTQKAKQAQPGGFKAGPCPRDAPTQTRRDHCHHHEGNRLATSLGPWLPNEDGAQKTRPREAFIGTATSTPPKPFTSSPIYEPPDGCDRKPGKRFGDEAYAMEELVAELGAAFLCADLGITSEPRADHAHYLDLWHNALRRWGH